MDSAAADASLSATTQPPPPPPQSETLDHIGDAANAAAGAKKPAWIVPSNGSSSSVMGASWPALSESARSSPKLPDGSAPAPPGPVVAQNAGDPNSNSTPAPALAPTRQNSMKRAAGVGGGSSTLPNGGHVVSSPESSPKGLPNNNGNNPENGGRGGGSSPQPHGANDHHRGYGGNRRGNGGGGGPRNVNYVYRRDQEHEWNHRNFNSRDVHMQPPPPRGVRPFLRPPGPVVAPFIAPHQPVRPGGNQMMYPDMPSPVYYMAAPPPFIAHPPPPAMFFPPVDPQRAMLVQQIEYYFSPQNLCRDVYLRRNMDEHGWVSIHLISGFNRVKQLTSDIQYILDTVRSSSIVEAQGEKIRKRNDWMNWVLPSAPQSPVTPTSDALAAHLQAVVLDEDNSHN